jgi:hypothetical protein
VAAKPAEQAKVGDRFPKKEAIASFFFTRSTEWYRPLTGVGWLSPSVGVGDRWEVSENVRGLKQLSCYRFGFAGWLAGNGVLWEREWSV